MSPPREVRLAVGVLVAALVLPAGSLATATPTARAAGSAAAAAPGAATLAAPAATGTAGAAGVVQARLTLSPAPPAVDVMVLLDNSVSEERRQRDVLQQLTGGLASLSDQGADVRAGLSLVGTTFTAGQEKKKAQDQRDYPTIALMSADPTSDSETPGYTGPPKLFTRPAAIGPVSAFTAAAAAASPEIIPLATGQRGQGQLVGIDQVLTGRGFLGTPNDLLRDAVPSGLAAGWRTTAGTIRILVDITDQTFDNLRGAPTAADGTPDVAGEGAKLAAQGVRHVGLVTFGRDLVVEQLAQLSAASGTFVPAGGLACGGLLGDEVVPAGAGLVCTDTQAAKALQAAVDGYPHTGRLRLAAGKEAGATTDGSSTPAVFRAMTGQVDTQADAWAGGAVSVSVPFACPTASVESRHDLPLSATYDGTQVATGTATVTCLATGATAPAASPPPAPDTVPVSLPPGPASPTAAALPPPPPASAAPTAPPAQQQAQGAGPTAVALAQAPPPPAVVAAPAVAPAVAPAPAAAQAAAQVAAPVAAPGAAGQAVGQAAAVAAPAGQVAAVVAPQPGLAFGVAEEQAQLELARQAAHTSPRGDDGDEGGDGGRYAAWLACLVLLFGGVSALHVQRQHAAQRPATVTAQTVGPDDDTSSTWSSER